MVDGRPLEELKVVELRKELEIRNLPKSGNKKELYDRLKNYLVNSGEAGNPTPSMSPQVCSTYRGADQTVIQKDVAAPEGGASVHPYVKLYLANQQEALAKAKLNADLVRGTSEDSEGTFGSPTHSLTTHPAEHPDEPVPTAGDSQQPTPPALLENALLANEGVVEPSSQASEKMSAIDGKGAKEDQPAPDIERAHATSGDVVSESEGIVRCSGSSDKIVISSDISPSALVTGETIANEEDAMAAEELDYGEGLDDGSQSPQVVKNPSLLSLYHHHINCYRKEIRRLPLVQRSKLKPRRAKPGRPKMGQSRQITSPY